MDEPHYTVYCHTNKVDGKKYFGMTGTTVEDRWANGRGYNHQPFGRAIRKYGWDGFEHTVIKSGLTEREACELETSLIEEHKTRDKRYGYNVCEGGSTGTTGVKYGEEVRKNMSVATLLTYERDPTLKSKISESVKKLYENPEYAEHMRQKRKEVWQRPGYREHQVAVRKGVKRGPISEETKAKLRAKNTGQKRSKEVCQKFSDAQRKTPVLQYSKGMEFIAEFRSISEAGDRTGARKGCISLCCQGKRRTAGGYIWKYKAGDNDDRA